MPLLPEHSHTGDKSDVVTYITLAPLALWWVHLVCLRLPRSNERRVTLPFGMHTHGQQKTPLQPGGSQTTCLHPIPGQPIGARKQPPT